MDFAKSLTQMMVKPALSTWTKYARRNLMLLMLTSQSIQAEAPEVRDPIGTIYAEPEQPFDLTFDLNQVFQDPDGGVMTFGGITQADGSELPTWLSAEPIKLSGVDYVNDAQAVAVVDDIAYVANANYGLLIFNVSDPTETQFLGNLQCPDLVFVADTVVQSDVAYAADRSIGFLAINVSDAANPALFNLFDSSGAYGAVFSPSQQPTS